MKFEWDEKKRLININKHRIDFAEANKIFASRTVTIEDDRFDYDERRFVSYGLLQSEVVAVVYTERGDRMRIISIRKASKNERKAYIKAIKDRF